jgi:hypothetical protein
MNHPTVDELAAEAFGLATLEEHDKVSRHLRDCESCIEEFAWRCMEGAALEEAIGPRPQDARAGWRLPAVAALVLGAFIVVLALPSRDPGMSAGSGMRDVRDPIESVSLTLKEGGPDATVLSVKGGTVTRKGETLEMSGAVQLTTEKKVVIDAVAAAVDYGRKTLALDLSWPASVDRTRLSAVPLLEIRARHSTSWSEGPVTMNDLNHAVVRVVFRSVPAPGDPVLLKEVSVTVEAESVRLETIPAEGVREQQRLAFSGPVHVLLPNGRSFDCDEVTWDLSARPMPTATFRLK